MSLKTKNVFLTGGAMGLGKNFMDGLLAAGAKVFFGDINASAGEKTEKEFHDKYGTDTVKFQVLDITDRIKFEEAFAAAVRFLGHVDLMVNNAGIADERDPEKVIQTNYTALVIGTRMAAEHMRKDKGGKGGRIINIGSICSLEDNVTAPVYSGTKHAVRAFTSSQAIAPDIQQQGIEYAVFCPSTIATNMHRDVEKKLLYIYTITREMYEVTVAPIEVIQKGFIRLVTLEEMNGAILYVSRFDSTFRRLENVNLGDSWPAEDADSTVNPMSKIFNGP